MTADRQAAVLAKLRSKGLGLAPVMAAGRIVAPRPSDKLPGQRGALGAPVADLSPAGPITRLEGLKPAEARTAPGAVFEFTVEAPCAFLNANDTYPHWSHKSRKVKSWRRAGRFAAADAGLPAGLPRLQVDAFVVKPILNDYDPANWAPTAKAVLDGLIDYGLAEDDNRRFVTGPFMHEGGRGADALVVRVTVLASS